MKMIIFFLILFAIVFINYKFKNVIVRGYNFFSQFPKMILIGLGFIVVVCPFLLKDNPFINYFKDFMPDSLSKKLDLINGIKERNNNVMKNILENPQEMPQYMGRGKGVSTKQLRKVSEQVKKKIAADQGWQCAMCNNKLDAAYEVDHIIALEDGGTNNIDNLRAVCRNCHGNKTIDDNIKRRYPGGMFA